MRPSAPVASPPCPRLQPGRSAAFTPPQGSKRNAINYPQPFRISVLKRPEAVTMQLEMGSAAAPVLCRNLSLVAKRPEEISQPQGGWYGRVVQLCPERTTERFMVSTVLSGRGATVGFPATAWLANFHRRFATKRWFLQSMARAFRRRDLRGCPNRERTGGTPVPL